MTEPKRLGKYEILEEIGRGGFAAVYKARDTQLDRVVALKVLHPQLTTDPKFVQRFHQEARTAAGLRHPHIVTIHDVGGEAGQHYLAMAFLPGRTLDRWLAKGPLPVEQAVSIAEQIARALDVIHERGLVHRDVKPGNIMVDDAGQATLVDFGIVRAAEGTRLTTTMAALGTPEYMAPEQAELDEAAEIDWRADIYALGVVAYEMLVGRPPFAGRSPTAVLYKHVHEPPPAPRALNPDIPADLEPALLKALAKEQGERFQQAGDFAAALRRAPRAESPVREPLRRPQRRAGLAWWAVAGGAILVLIVGLGIAMGPRLFGTGSEPPQAPTLEPGITWTRPADGMVMVHVPGGTFQMGSTESDPDAEGNESPQHPVTLDAFWINQTEVTNAQYRRCVEAGACQVPTTCDWETPTYVHEKYADHPAICVDWYGAAAYCEWAGARLPTEAEWEYAARGPDNFVYPWGNSPPDSTRLNYAANVGDTTKVGSYPDGASWCEALDMAGNVWEWAADWYGTYPSEAQTNPTGQPVGETKPKRGGSYWDDPTCTRTTCRHYATPDSHISALGFRCAGQAGE